MKLCRPFACWAGFLLASALIITDLPAQSALNPALAPGRNFNLSGWKLQLPISSQDPNGLMSLHTSVTEVSGSSLTTYTSAYFYTNSGDGAMRFYAPITGDTTSGSEYPRSELREQYTPAQSDWYDTYGTAILNASLKVEQVPLTNKVIIGQIHGDVPDAVMTILEYQAGTVYADINYSPLVDEQVRLTFANVGPPVSALITYQLKMVPGAVFVTVNGSTQAMLIDQSTATGWPTASVYFKAGDYCQGNPTTEGASPPADDGASTAFYSLGITHLNGGLQVATTSLPGGGAGVPYSQSLQTAQASGAVTWSLVNGVIGVTGGGSIPIGTLPPGLNLSPAGIISGTPQAGDAGHTYANIIVQATDATGAAAIQNLSLAIAAVTGFTTQPVSQTVLAGSTVVFSATAPGASAYEWQLNGTAIAGATSARLVVSDPQAASAGLYTAVATTSAGTMVSTPATLSLAATTNPGRLVNLSVNTTAGKGQVLTVGFVSGGAGTAGPETVLLRSTGPALAAFGVANFLADPTLALFSGATVIDSNDNWGASAGNQAAVTAADSVTNAFPLTNPASLDAALVTSLTAGGYTVQVSGNTAALGTTLAEVYDGTPVSAYTLATPRLINISANNQIAPNGSMTAGFVIGGTTAKTVLIRATGPALAAEPFNLTGTMPDPQLALHTTLSGQDTVLSSNAGWGGDPQIATVDAAVGAFALMNPASKDSVVLMTLAPGSYTAVASSVTGAGGIVLIEVYEVSN